jgi:hypothetical protein
VATKDISKGEPVFQIPCHLVVSSYDDFEDRDTFYGILIRAEFKYPRLKYDITYLSKSLLAINYMIQEKFYPDDPFQAGKKYGEEAKKF